jgi:hypothetical protein
VSSSQVGAGRRGRRGALARRGTVRRGWQRALADKGAAGDDMGWRHHGEWYERMATRGEFF